MVPVICTYFIPYIHHGRTGDSWDSKLAKPYTPATPDPKRLEIRRLGMMIGDFVGISLTSMGTMVTN